MTTGRLFFGIMFSDRGMLNNAVRDLTGLYGAATDESQEYGFDRFTSYYEKEMGKGLLKKLIVFNSRIGDSDLARIKNEAARIENAYSVRGRRKVNIDPGYISESKVVLASLKGRDFKKSLGNGVYAHEIFRAEKGILKPYFHTFKDYLEKDIISFLQGLI